MLRLPGPILPALLLVSACFGCSAVKPPVTAEPAKDVVVAAPPEVVASPPPKAVDPTLALEVTPESTVVSTTATEAFVRVHLEGLARKDVPRPTLNLALVVDTSGSMAGDPIDRAKAACDKLVDAMSEGDVLSIVTFGSKPTVLVHASKLDDATRAAAHRAVAGIVADGTTDMTGGLDTGIAEVRAQLSPDKINRIILMGDGVPNDPGSILARAAMARDIQVPITALGLGPAFDETQMTAIATTSGGAFHFVDDAARVADVFRDEILKMQRITARSVMLELLPGPGVSIVETLGLPFAPTGRGASVMIGDLAEEQSRDVIVHVQISPRGEGSRLELLDTTAHYVPASADQSLEVSRFVALDVSNDAVRLGDATNVELAHQVARLRVANGIVQAIALARAGDVVGARSLIDATIKLATASAKRFADDDLTGKAKEALKLRGTLASLAPPPAPVQPTGVVTLSPMPTPPMPTPPPLTPSAALEVRAIHGDSEHELQGFR
ncbi:MAG: VWA domain-containing protein [Polyangiaceae bacterium]